MKIAILADLHFGVRSDSEYFRNEFKIFLDEQFFPYVIDNDIKTLWILGDIFERRKFIEYKTLDFARYFFNKLKENNIAVYIVVGNHDVYYKNTLELTSIKLLLDEYDNITYSLQPKEYIFDGENVLFVPWICSENYDECMNAVRNSDSKICCGHFEFIGFKINKFSTSKHGIDYKLFRKFDKVLTGHFHIKSEMDNVLYVGSPMQTSWNDYGTCKGFHIYDTKDKSLEFVKNKRESFVVVKTPEDINDSLKDKLVRVLVEDYKKSDDIVKKISEHNPQDVKVICTNSLFKREVNDDTVEVDLLDTKKVIIDNANKYLRDGMSIDKMKGILEELFAQTKKD